MCEFLSKSQEAQGLIRPNASVQVQRQVIELEKLSCKNQAFLFIERSAFLLYSCLQRIRWDSPTVERAFSFTQSMESNIKSIQKCPYRLMFDQISRQIICSLQFGK